jgi:hypothetical protein
VDITSTTYLNLANKIAEEFITIPTVEAIALSGSQSGGSVDHHSDIDLYIYAREAVPLDHRQEIVDKFGASRADLNLTFWDTGDEWFDLETGIEVDIMYWDPSWIEDQLERVLTHHQASMGYSTCFWHTVIRSQILFDRRGWFTEMQSKANQAYPEQLKLAILAKNHPILRRVIPSYYGQIKKAIERRDLISINHRLAALFASYFDVLFALNEVMNPGEKKLLNYVEEVCPELPENLQTQVEDILLSGAAGDEVLLPQLDELLDGLDEILVNGGYDPARTLMLDNQG